MLQWLIAWQQVYTTKHELSQNFCCDSATIETHQDTNNPAEQKLLDCCWDNCYTIIPVTNTPRKCKQCALAQVIIYKSILLTIMMIDNVIMNTDGNMSIAIILWVCKPLKQSQVHHTILKVNYNQHKRSYAMNYSSIYSITYECNIIIIWNWNMERK